LIIKGKKGAMGFEKRKEKSYIDERLLIRGSFIPSRLSFFLSSKKVRFIRY
jgi:hypothetical protein